ncbi:diguanylate cyclase domain-containing protein [Deinococcus sp.]|uniref:GGDEF domain-containing protein n=1 Tax=Deinococcus sp. TaxID=47478 RepID=UPI003CC67082
MFSWTRFLILLALLLTVVGSMGGVLWANRRSGEAVLQSQARDSLTQLVRVTGDNVGAYLQTAVQILHINRSLILSGQLSPGKTADVTLTFNTMLYAIEQLDGVLLAHPDGRFVYVRREGAGRYIKVIDDVAARRSSVTKLDAENRVLLRVTSPDPYDPRTRPWFTLAAQHPGQTVWTAPYVFSSSRLPGVTVATKLQTPQGNSVVVGIDVQLSGLVRLLEHLKLTPGGRAFITDASGYAIAASRAWPKRVKGRVPTLAEVGDPALQALLGGGAVPNLASSSELTRRYQVGQQAYSAVLRRIEVQPGTSWMVGVYAPETDFVGDLRSVARQQFMLIVAMTLLSILIAWPLAYRATQPLAALHLQATTDGLTGLRNRASFLAQLAEDLQPGAAHRTQTELGVALFDLDGFKAINDTYGHAVGDQALEQMGAALRRAVRSGEVLARMGGDEFALLVRGPDRIAVRLRIEEIFQLISATSLEGAGLNSALRATAGLAFGQPDPVASPEQAALALLARADTVLIWGKKREKGRVWLADEAQDAPTPS